MKFIKQSLIAIAALGFLSACQAPPMQMGDPNAKTVATGSAAGSTTAGANNGLERCAAPLGTISLIENVNAPWYYTLTNDYRLPPTAGLLRLMIQQSNCFVVVERGASGMAAMNRERDLQNSGQMRAGSNFGGGQMVSSDFGLSPEITFSARDTGGVGGALGGLIGGGAGRALAVIGAQTKTREASVLLTMIDNRSSVQIAASEGSASKTDFGGFGALFGVSGAGGLGAYTNTPQGKVIAAAFMDAYNGMVISLRQYKMQQVQGGLGMGGQLPVDGATRSPTPTRSTQQAAVTNPVSNASCLGLKDQDAKGPFCNSGVTITIVNTKVEDTGTAGQFRCRPVFKVENNSGKLLQAVHFYFRPIRNGVDKKGYDVLSGPKLSMRPGQSFVVDSTGVYSDGKERCANVEYMLDSTNIT
jgi:curli biogenesis system outer membrane secretion channel CsgG